MMAKKKKAAKRPGLLDIIPEVRLTIWKFALPSNGYLILDPGNIQVPGPIFLSDYLATASLLHVSKQVYNEVLPILYSRNIVAVLQPYAQDNHSLKDLPEAALQTITKLELCLMDGLADMGPNGQLLLSGGLLSIKHLRLNFWHEKLWLRPAMELAHRAWRDEQFVFKLELYESVHHMGYSSELDDDIIDYEYQNALNMASVYDIKIPESLDTITVSASVSNHAGYAFAVFKNDEHYPGWRFNKDGDKDTKKVKYLVWESEEKESA